MITVALSATIAAPLDRVWRALSDPSERPAWDERVLGEIHIEAGPPRGPGGSRSGFSQSERPLQRRRWRYRLRSIPLVLREDLLSRDAHARLVSRISIGAMSFDQTLTLHREDDAGGPVTRVGMKVVSGNSIPVLGDRISRLDVQRLVIEYVDTTLRQVRAHCESCLSARIPRRRLVSPRGAR